ncbi:APC family permease [Patulibacter sp. SYSU D01012]|uniref:APC family permease n=1 Tax=Patulibacter sp. SYSU D01012 TaxID=2817381 RepID=UPI001B30C49C
MTRPSDPAAAPASPAPPAGGLVRRLGTGDAVVIGLGSMVGAGIFSALGPAAREAGSGLLVALALAAFVAYANATSTAQLAARHPLSGGTYLYGRERLGPWWGFVAGWGFVVGKLASCAAMALTFGAYVAPGAMRPLAVGAVVLLVALNLRGIARTAQVTRVLVAIVLAALAAVLVGTLLGGRVDAGRIGPVLDGGAYGILQAAGLLFFAFAGYARIATLGEEVRDPARTIPRAIPLALGITVALYAAVAVAALLAVGPDALAASAAPLADTVRAGDLDALAPAVRVGAAVGSLAVLLSLIAGVSRTTLAMARERDLPAPLAAVDPRHGVPARAELAAGAIVIAVVLLADVRGAIAFSSFGVLVYYAVANASALRLAPDERRWPRALAGAGLVGCVVLAATLPAAGVAVGAGVLLAGVVGRWVALRAGGA